MTNPITLWRQDGAAHGWTMPSVPGWWRWWGVRHVRALRLSWLLSQHEDFWGGLGFGPSQCDRWVLFGIWHGLELKQDEPGGGE